MKRIVKIILWFLFACMCVGALGAGFMDVNAIATEKDIMLYHIGGSMIFMIVAIGLLIELNIFHVREHFPLVREKSIGKHIIFWTILCFVSCMPFIICYGLTSTDFKNSMMQYAEEQKGNQETDFEEEIVIANNAEKSYGEDNAVQEFGSDEKQSADAETGENTKTIEEYEEIGSEEIEGYDYDGAIFYFEDAVYVVNGVEIIFNSITFDKVICPNGYTLTFDYSVENTNHTDVTLKFDSQAGEFRWNGGYTRLVLSINNYGSDKYAADMTMGANQKMENMLVLFDASSNADEKVINGLKYPKIELGDIYMDEQIECDVVFNVWVDDYHESFTATFTFN
ncbi:MAG: hypothetical protein NC337_11125 [Roseburia sp.]|nr:hypothetical protein [Roseburia sp.]